MQPFLTIEHSSGTTPVYQLARLAQLAQLLRAQLATSDRQALITSPALMALYGDQLSRLDLPSRPLLLPDGEEYKNLSQAEKLWQQIAELGLSRHSALIAFGGGVVTDMVGFIAAGYMRGIEVVYLPTTLLAQVDASLGGKTGVNLPNGKNLVGFFHQPRSVILCLDLLKSLPPEEMTSGYAEIIKAALLADRDFFIQLEGFFASSPSEENLAPIIRRSCEIKAHFIQQDETEKSRGSASRALLNLGHTFGHALEARQSYRGIKHGHAVAIGICLAAAISTRLGNLSQSDYHLIEQLIRSAGLPTRLPVDLQPAYLIDFMRQDKKKKDSRISLILLAEIGKAYLSQPYEPAQILELMEDAVRWMLRA